MTNPSCDNRKLVIAYSHKRKQLVHILSFDHRHSFLYYSYFLYLSYELFGNYALFYFFNAILLKSCVTVRSNGSNGRIAGHGQRCIRGGLDLGENTGKRVKVEEKAKKHGVAT